MMALAALTVITILSVTAATAPAVRRPQPRTTAVRRRHPAGAGSVLNVMAGRRARVAGTVAPGDAGRRVSLQKRAGSRWITVARAVTAPGGGVPRQLPAAAAHRARRCASSPAATASASGA